MKREGFVISWIEKEEQKFLCTLREYNGNGLKLDVGRDLSEGERTSILFTVISNLLAAGKIRYEGEFWKGGGYVVR